MNGWQQAGFLILGGLISGMVGVGLPQFQQWQRRRVRESNRGGSGRRTGQISGIVLIMPCDG